MIGWQIGFYYFVIGAMLLLTIMGLWFTFIMPFMDKWDKQFFIIYFLALAICSIASLIDLLIVQNTNSQTILYVLAYIEILTLSIPAPLMTVYLIHCRKENLSKNKLLYLVLSLWLIFIVVLTIAPLNNYIYYISNDRSFLRGPWFSLLMVPLIIIMFINLIITIKDHKILSHKYFIGFLIAIGPLTISLIIHTFFDVTPLVDISFAIGAISMFGLVLSDQVQKQLNQRASILVLQMRPHFIYNTLMSIYSLCNQNPNKARQVTMDFTNYLRKNFNAVVSESPIPFSTELEHTKAYLAVEQAQHEDMLVVGYDIPFVNFRIPPLTLQPIVENAVKYGIDPYAGPLHVLIKTIHNDSYTQIIVEDNGPGFDQSKKSEQYSALDNIKQRLKIMCNGNMSIESQDKKGTVVTITIPSVNNISN